MPVWTSASLKGVAFGGLIKQDVMDKIFDISRIPLPMQDLIGSGSVANSYAEWTTDKLGAPNTGNKVVDGADVSAQNAAGGARVGNQCQNSVKSVQVSKRANASDTIGRSNELAYQIMMRQQELRRDVDATLVTNHASVADDGTVTAGQAGTLRAWLKSHTDIGATGANGGFSAGVVAAATPGTPRAGSFAKLKDLLQGIYVAGGNPTVLMSVVGVIRGLSEYMFGSTAQIATLQSDQGAGKTGLTARGAVNVFVSDFGVVVELQDNRLQTIDGTGYDLFALDPQYLEIGFLTGYQTEALAKTGLAEKRLMSADWTLKVLSEEAQGVYADLSLAAWTA